LRLTGPEASPYEEIYKYLEKRLKVNEQETPVVEIKEAKEIQANEIEFHNANVRIYLSASNNQTQRS
jgi:hypothetical protein